MKYLICSDIHGSFFYMEKVLSFFDDSFDKILFLGDILYHGPRNDLPKEYNPKKVISLINPLKNKIICVKGNCDAEVDQMVLDFKILDDYRFEYLGKKFLMVHGHHLDFNNLKKENADVILYGHYHISQIKIEDDVLLVNPGSISIPKSEEGNTFMILDNNVLKLLNVDGNVIKEYIIGEK